MFFTPAVLGPFQVFAFKIERYQKNLNFIIHIEKSKNINTKQGQLDSLEKYKDNFSLTSWLIKKFWNEDWDKLMDVKP